MAAKPQFTKAGFLKSYFLPALIIFLVPGFGLWFFDLVESSTDSRIRDGIITNIQADGKMTAEEREETLQFYQRVPVSRILASNKAEARPLQAHFSSVKTEYAIFRWMKRVALACLITASGIFLAVAMGVAWSFRSQSAQYWSLRIGWNLLRWFALIQVVGQGILTVALSFWITAFWFESYYPKLIIVAAVLALGAVALLIKAIFRKIELDRSFAAKPLPREAAPALWQRVSDMASRLGIAPPDNILVGIDDNFFVTEQELTIEDKPHAGRTLFVSLSLLKTLSRSEADAVLGHELAHFSGEDTVYSMRTSPLLGRYAHYLEALHQGGLSKPVFYFMFFFWNLYQLSLGKLSREREFRADRIGSELTSPRDVAQALVRISAYSRYRRKVQATLFEKDENVETMDVFQRLEQGFPAFMSGAVIRSELADADTPHPFDSHPPLSERIASLGLDPESVLKSPGSLPNLEDTWFSAIGGAASIEAEQWKAFEDSFQQAHEVSLAYRFKPEGEIESRHVAKHFPEVVFRTSKGVTASLDYEKVRLSEWDSAIWFSSIASCKLEETLGRHRLVIDYLSDGEQKNRKGKIPFKELKSDSGEFLPTFEKYYGRHMVAKAYLAEKAKHPETGEA